MDLLPLWVSIKTSITSTIITSILGIFLSYKMYKYRGFFKNMFDNILMLPLILPPTVVGFFLLLIIGKNGFIGKILYDYLNISLIFSWEATVISSVIVSFPLMYKISIFAFEQVDKNLLYSAEMLCSKKSKIFFKILFPLAWPGICSGIILAFARGLGEFGATLMVSGNISGRTQTIPLAIYFAVENGKIENALIWVMIIFAMSSIGIYIINYFGNKNRKVYF